jgi:ribosomal protein S27AE
MDYMLHYNRLIETRKTLSRSKKEGYFELHHIVPKCYGGSNKPDNLVLLTAREHFLAHWLLWRANRDKKSAAMFNAMTRTSKNQFRIKSGRGYEEAKLAGVFSQQGKVLSEEVKLKIKLNNARTGKPNWNSGKAWTKTKVQCSKCGDFTSVDHNKRWHEDNCQFEEFKKLLELYSRKEICILKNISNVKLQYWISKIKKKNET